jgi:RNA recognition motif-containing protein
MPSFLVDESKYTTVMVRNIPCKYKQEEMVAEVARITENFDFLYLPPARTAKVDKNLGYAFINFRTPADAQLFMEEFQGHQFTLYKNSTKRALVLFADLQGFEDNVQYYRKSKVTRTKFRPYISN